jgi:5-methylcytosine-specific restriction endonuclease McrA
MPFDEYIKTSKTIQTNKIRRKLFKEGLKEKKCERCGNTTWNNMPIPLEVHHKDGCKENNQLENLEILCPNCHAQTDSYRGRNCRKI